LEVEPQWAPIIPAGIGYREMLREEKLEAEKKD
jgi:hypothetical protein